ncbi:TPA: hypothetical protein ACPSKY_003480 [Legionella bozemanae]|uniref:Uncharacterized protein n=1 Tax=Fluoribacter dumoffii TaxID=463 RepID=A0A377IUC2_9GAMM|nr:MULTISPECIES: hypothetical protein [Legionellaceae]MCW8485179.1 hypothetical protein [Fluoribacter dumoffii]STO91728.1 Uncharacterised protein [Fluoribacter dumoffii]STP13959.1 Uncharacterised protein [Legionella bozemanae]
MNVLFVHMPLLIASFVFLLGICLLVLTHHQRMQRKTYILGTAGFLLSFFGLIAIIIILYLAYFPRLR